MGRGSVVHVRVASEANAESACGNAQGCVKGESGRIEAIHGRCSGQLFGSCCYRVPAMRSLVNDKRIERLKATHLKTNALTIAVIQPSSSTPLLICWAHPSVHV